MEGGEGVCFGVEDDEATFEADGFGLGEGELEGGKGHDSAGLLGLGF